jgi:hypothetical protein
MAELEDIRDDLLTPIYGRRLGIDRSDRLGGFTGIREPITQATSDSTATKLPAYGWIVVTSESSLGWVLSDPVVGAEVRIMTGSTSTAEHAINTDNATIKSSFGTTQTQVVMEGGGAGMTMVGLSTSQWAILQKSSTSAVQVTS